MWFLYGFDCKLNFMTSLNFANLFDMYMAGLFNIDHKRLFEKI